MSDCTHTKYEGCKPCPCDTVTITISRKDAEAFQDPDGNWVDGSTERLAEACRAALEGER